MGLSRRPRGPLPWRRALETLALTVCLSVWTQSAAAEVTNATVGQTVKLTSPVTADISSFNWYKGTVVVDPQLICTCFVSPPKQLNGPQYTGRETGHPDGSLVIRDLLRNYTGNYTVFVTPNGARPVTATRELRVYASTGKNKTGASGSAAGAGAEGACQEQQEAASGTDGSATGLSVPTTSARARAEGHATPEGEDAAATVGEPAAVGRSWQPGAGKRSSRPSGMNIAGWLSYQRKWQLQLLPPMPWGPASLPVCLWWYITMFWQPPAAHHHLLPTPVVHAGTFGTGWSSGLHAWRPS